MSKALDSQRTYALIGTGGCGKTSLAEMLLFQSGVINRLGAIEEGTTTLDYEPEEIKRNVTIQLGIAPCEWEGYKMNFIDTPGYSEFCGEVRAALRACDGILLVVSAESGVDGYGTGLGLRRRIEAAPHVLCQ